MSYARPTAAILFLSIFCHVAPAQEPPEAPTQEQTAPAAVDPGSTDASTAVDGGLTLADATVTARNYGLRVFWAVVVVILTYQLIRGSVFVLERLAERSAQRRLLYKRLIPIIRLLLWAFALFLIVRVIFDVSAQGLLAAAAAIGVAVGFAAQDILKNIFGGLVIVADKPFQVGDHVAVGGTYGEVMSIGLRSTRIRTPDDNSVSVPNSQVVNGQVSNANSGQLDCQVVTDLYLPGWVDEREVKEIAYQAAASSKYAYLDKPIVVLAEDEFSHTHVLHIRVKAYVLDARYAALFASDVTESARAAFRRAGLITPAKSRTGNGLDDEVPRTPREGSDEPPGAAANAPDP